MRGLAGRLLAAAAGLAVVVAAAFAFIFVALAELRDAEALARRAADVTASANRLERLVVDVETGQRGYLIAGDEPFLGPWRSARAELPRESARLRELIDDDGQRRRADAIAAAVAAYVREYSVPLVATARRDLDAARATAAAGVGKRRVDRIRSLFRTFETNERALVARRSEAAADAADRAVAVAVGGLAASVLVILAFAAYLTRAIATPVRRVSAAAARLGTGDMEVRVDETGPGELAELARGFNAMAHAVGEAQAELERQNVELVAQASELEESQLELAAANDELEAQRGELERALVELAEEKERVETLFAFGQQLAAETNLEALGELVLRTFADLSGSEAGALYVCVPETPDSFALAATRALDARRLPRELPKGSLARRALAERRLVGGSHGESGLRLDALGADVAVRHELHVPLAQGPRTLGVATLARLVDRPFSEDDRTTVEHLAGQAAVALANTVALRSVERLAEINHAVLDATTDAIRMVDLQGRTIVVNTAMEAMAGPVLGFADEATIWEATDALAERTTDPAGYRASVGALRADPEAEGTHVYQLRNGRWLRRYSGPVRDAAGRLVGRIFVIRDVTAEREAEQLKSDLVATVSHELRTPLTGILGFAELLELDDSDPQTRKEYIATIRREGDRLRSLINDFLDLHRIEEGTIGLSVELVDLATFVNEQARLYASQSALHALELDVRGPLYVLAEPDRVTQVLGNLFSNAVKYSPRGGVIGIRAFTGDGVVRVEVSDQGIGIPHEQQRRIFEKFFRAETSQTRRIGGTGLGLALARDIVEAHGGRIGFDSVEGEGSTFWFELPAAAPTASAPQRALVVEDDPTTAELMRVCLAADGFDVEVAASGEEALSLAEARLPSVVCLDIGLAGPIDGWELISRLKSAPRTATIPIVVCTGAEEAGSALALGASDFVTKPFSQEVLRETVLRLLPTGGCVLTVDDDETVRRLITDTLALDGLRVREAADGEEALEEIRRDPPDAVVLDLMMPKVDGFAVLEALRDDPRTRLLPVVVLTAKRLTAAERAVLGRRAAMVLEKGAYSAADLRRLVRTAIGA